MDNTKIKINVNELDRIDFLEPQLKIIRKHRRETIIGLYIALVGTMFIALFIPYMILSEDLELIKTIFISGVEIIMVVVIFYLIKIILSTHRSLYQKAQYGVIEKKFTKTHKNAKNNRKTSYYFNVSFPEKNVFIENVSCKKGFYLESIEGDKVLVISFYKNDLQAISAI